MIRLGFLEDFKGASAVLLSCSPKEAHSLCLRIKKFVESQAQEVPLHNEVAVSLKHPAKLFLSRSSNGPGFRWLCSEDEWLSIQDKLEALSRHGSGHQYFNLVASQVELVVSVGEYDESWWQNHG